MLRLSGCRLPDRSGGAQRRRSSRVDVLWGNALPLTGIGSACRSEYGQNEAAADY